MERRAHHPSIWEAAGRRRPPLHEPIHGGNDQNAGGGTDGGEAFDFALGAAWRTAVSLAMDCIGHFLYRHLDAERRRRLADDADDPESVHDWAGAGGRGAAGVPGDPARRRAGGFGGPAALSVAHAGLDGVGFGDAWHHDAGQLRRTVDAAAVYISAGPRRGDE